MLVRQIIGDKVDEIWNVIMSEGGKESKALAESLGSERWFDYVKPQKAK
jgi:hypothetical protein